ncbi:MAG: hydantoinase/oxoprolinase family protein, partial [Mesorhizobium sp.]
MTAKTKSSPLFLGIDTGGTYTDAVLWSEAGGPSGKVHAKAKALTTRHDLAVGISGAVDAVLQKAGTDPAAIKLVSMSTTLATNALVEGQGGRVALVMIGFSEGDRA